MRLRKTVEATRTVAYGFGGVLNTRRADIAAKESSVDFDTDTIDFHRL